MPRITTADDLGQLNKALQKIDKLEKRILNLSDQVLQTQKRVTTLDALHAPTPTTNDLVFTWTGATGTISWPQGSLQDKNAQTVNPVAGALHTVPIAASAIAGLTPNTHYWFGWSKTQNQMVALTDAHPLLNNPDVHVICRLFTGGGGVTGVAGGGGSESLRDLSGLTYKNF